jgi:hypothetical protein
MKSGTSFDGSRFSIFAVIALGVLAVLCCAGPVLVAALGGSALLLLIGSQETLVAVLGAAIVVGFFAMLVTRSQGKSLWGLVRDAVHLAFSPPALKRSATLTVVLGAPLTMFYLVALPAERFGALAWGALQFLTPGDAVASVVLGLGVPLSIALNFAAQRRQAAQTTLTLGGVIAALLPSSLCCTTLIPSALAALGASAPAIMHTSGRYQAFFAQHSAGFIAFAVAAVTFSFWLAARNLIAGCTTCCLPIKESR